MKKFLIAILFLGLWLPTVVSLMRPGFFSMYDDMQVIRLQQMDKCFKDGQFPCRWVPDLGYGYGYPLYEFYAPLPYYVMEGVHFLGWSYIDSVKIGFILAVLVGGVFFFWFARNFFSRLGAYGAATLYVFVPFRAADIYVRGAMGEVWGMAALPVALWGIERVFRKKDRWSVVILGFCTLVFLTSHNLTVLMAAPFLAVWVLVRLGLVGEKRREVGLAIFGGGLLGVVLAGFFVVPLLAEFNQVHLETMVGGYFNYLAHFVDVRQLFWSFHWGYGPSILGPNDDLFLGLGPVHMGLAILGMGVLLRKRRKEWPIFAVMFLGLLAAVFLAHQRSSFLWENLPFLAILQFPWRFLLMASFCAAFLGGGVFELVPRFSGGVVLAVWVGLMVVYGGFFVPKDWFLITDGEKLSGSMWERQVTASIYDYLPKSAEKAPDGPAPESLIVERGEVEVKEIERGSNWFRYRVEVVSEEAEVVVPVYDFPGWKVWVDGEEREIERRTELGLLGVNLVEGDGVIEVKLRRSWPRMVGDGMSVLGLVASGVIVWKGRRKK